MYLECVRAGEWALEHAGEFPAPLLLMHGTADRLTSWEASREFARRVGRNATWRKWDGSYHELHNEPQGRQVIKVDRELDKAQVRESRGLAASCWTNAPGHETIRRIPLANNFEVTDEQEGSRGNEQA